VIAVILLATIAGCGEPKDTEFDAVSGTVSRNYQPDPQALLPADIGIDSELDFYFLSEKLVFVGDRDTSRYALTVTFGRGLNDNRFRRAEREFSGFLFDGAGWRPLTYTKARHDSTSLLEQTDYYFGTLAWQQRGESGEIRYDRRGLAFRLEFDGLRPIQAWNPDSVTTQAHAVGQGALFLDSDTISGRVVYQLIQLEGFNPIVGGGSGITRINHDWLALAVADDGVLVASSDSSAANNRIHKNFMSLLQGDSVVYADGANNFRIMSEAIRRDAQIGVPLALTKTASVPELGISFRVDLTDNRFFYTNGFALAIVEGELQRTGLTQQVWGIVEHQQKPGIDPALLK
jgi:hypothetical protein